MTVSESKPIWIIWACLTPFLVEISLIIALGQNLQSHLTALPQAPTLTLWALPLSRLLTQISSVLAVGSLVFLGIIYPTAKKEISNPHQGIQNAAAGFVAIWLGATFTQLLFAISNAFAAPLSQVLQPNVLRSVVTQTQFGRIYLAQIVFIGIALLLISRMTNLNCVRLALGPVFAATFLPALGGHSGLSRNHELATSTMAVHVLSLSIWIGSLVALAIWFRSIPGNHQIALNRFSQLAMFCYFAVLLSGITNTWIRLGGFGNIYSSRYGQMVLLKLGLTLVIGILAYFNRQRMIREVELENFPTAFVIFEILILGAVLGIATVLARTGFPSPENNYLPTIAEQLLGIRVPEKLSLTAIAPDALWMTLTFLMALLYFRAVSKLTVSWPARRSTAFGLALALLTICTSGAVGVYSHVLFSAHMIQHMLLALVIPALLVISRPFTLAQQVGGDYQIEGPRDWFIGFYESKTWRLLTRPATLVILSLITYWGIYFTPTFGWLMSGHWGHVGMQVYLFVYGYALMWTVLGIDSRSHEVSIKQIYILLISEPIHIIFGVALLLSHKIVGESLFQIIDRPYLTDLIRDQKTGGIITLLVGETINMGILAWLVRRKSKN